MGTDTSRDRLSGDFSTGHGCGACLPGQIDMCPAGWSGSSSVPNVPLFSGIPQVSLMQNGYESIQHLSGEKLYSPKRERLLATSCECGTNQGLPATLLSMPLSAFCYGWWQNSTVAMSLAKALGQWKAQIKIQKIPFKLKSKIVFFTVKMTKVTGAGCSERL